MRLFRIVAVSMLSVPALLIVAPSDISSGLVRDGASAHRTSVFAGYAAYDRSADSAAEGDQGVEAAATANERHALSPAH